VPETISAPSTGTATGVGASALAAFGWGFAGIFGSLTSTSGIILTFYRCWLGAGLIVAATLLSGRRFDWRVLRTSALGGMLLCADMVCFFSAIKLTSVAVATVIGALQPVLVMLAAGPFVGERIDRWNLAWTILAVAGVGVIVVGAGAPSGDQRLGDLLALGSLAAWAAYFVVAKRASPKMEALEYTAGVTTVAALSTTVVVLVSGQSLARVQAGDWVWIALLAVIPTGAHLLMNVAHRYLDVSISSVIASSNPIVAAVAAWIILGQSLGAVQVAGGAVGVAAIAIVAARGGQPVASPVE
jgi:drug/metabolite transporter (DMT)-like permease